MASRAINTRKSSVEWRAGLRRSLRRAAQMTGAALLLIGMAFLALSLVSYTQTDPSPSTAASGEEVGNWMGLSGAWLADRALFIFGLPCVLLLPLLYISARKLWRDVETEDDLDAVDEPMRWWLPTGLLLIAMVLLATVLSLAFDSAGGTLPAQLGGVSGLLGAGAIEAIGSRFGEGASGWVILALALICLGGAAALLTRIFAIDWRSLLTLPLFLTGGATGVLARIPGLGGNKLLLAPTADDPDDISAPKSRRQSKKAA